MRKVDATPKSTKTRPSNKRQKPVKPYPDVPLFPHATRRWAKKVLGKLHDFGPWNDPDGMLQKWLDQKDDLLAGRTPHVHRDGLTVADLCRPLSTMMDTFCLAR